MMGAESMDATSCRQPKVLTGCVTLAVRAATCDPQVGPLVYQEDPGAWIAW